MTRSRPGPQLEDFVAIYERLARGEPLTLPDRRKLEGLLKQLLAGDDVRRQFYIPVEGRPRIAGDAVFIAIDVELRRESGRKLKTVKGEVAAKWGVSDAFVTRQHRLAGAVASAMMERATPAAIAKVVAWHRERFINSR